MKILFGTVLGALVCCPLAHGQQGVSSAGQSREQRAAKEKAEERIAWGKESNGLVANLRAVTTAVKPGEPIEFEIRIKNVSDVDVHLLGHLEPSPTTWSFDFGEWGWRPPGLSLPVVPLKPGDTISVPCLVATTRDSMTAEQKRRFLTNNGVDVAPFRNVTNKKESVRLPAGVYRVRAATQGFFGSDRNQRNVTLETNAIKVRIDDDTTDKPASRKLRDLTADDPIMSTYEHLYLEVTDPAKTEAVKRELAKYGRIAQSVGYHPGWMGAYLYDDVDTAAARAALATVNGVGETETARAARYDKRIPDLEATLKIGQRMYPVDHADGFDLTFVLTNVSMSTPCEFRSVESDMCLLDLKLEGPGAQSQTLTPYFTSENRRGETITLQPGKSYTLPINSLKYGMRYSQRWNWTRPGEYTLTAAYQIGEVRYEAKPVKLTVVVK